MTSRERARRRRGLLLMTPALITLGGLTLYPGLWVLWISLHERVPIFGINRFSGLRHYAFLATDPRFWDAARVTGLFTLASVGDRKSTRLNSSHIQKSRMPSSA